MKKFLVRIFILISILMIANIPLLLIAEQFYWRNYRFVKTGFESYLLADSHGLPLGGELEQYGIFNFSAGSDSYFDMFRKIKFLKRHTAVSKIYITADDHTLSIYREDNNNADRSVFFTDRDDFENSWPFIKEKYLKTNMALFNSKYRDVVRRLIKDTLWNNISINNTKDPEWVELSPEKRNLRISERKIFQFPSENVSLSLQKDLREIIQFCNIYGIELIGIKFPLAREYQEACSKYNYGADRILSENDITVYDFERIYADRDDYFENEDHLDTDGGRNFASIIAENVLYKF